MQAASQHLTREWWQKRSGNFDLFVSEFVASEARRGDPDAARLRLEAIASLRHLATTAEVIALARQLIDEIGLPARAAQDAYHMACAAVHEMDYLLTWNCTHIANAEFVPLIRSVCAIHGFRCPQICTPQELLTGAKL